MRRFKNSGFTLIEVMVVLAITAMLASMMLAGYIKFNRKRRVEAAALGFAQFLQTQQKRANSGDMSGCNDPDSILDGFEVRAWKASPGNLAQSEPVCEPSGGERVNFVLENESVFNGDFEVLFYPLSRGVAAGAEVVVVNGTTQYEVSVSQSGAITVADL